MSRVLLYELCRKPRLALTLLFALPLAPERILAAAPPGNDTCANAVVIPAAGPFPYLTSVVPDIAGAGTQGDPPVPEFFPEVSRSVWYRFTPGAAGFYVLSVNDTATTVQDTAMAVYRGTGGCGGPFELVASNDDAGFNQSAVATDLAANVTYYILVWKVLLDAPFAGETAVQLKVARPGVPANDVCAGAEVIPAAGPFPYATAVTNTIRAGTTGDPPAPSCGSAGYRSLWYRFSPASSGSYLFTTASNTATRVFDTLLAVYEAPGGCGGALTELGCNDDVTELRAAATVNLTAGATYFVVVWDLEEAHPGYNTLQLGVSRPGPPSVTTLAASGIASTGAVLRAQVHPAGLTTRFWFEWGTTTNYGNATPMQVLSPNLFNGIVSRPIAIPNPGVLYHYRVAATNGQGVVHGADRTFQWSGVAPRIDRIPLPVAGGAALRFAGSVGQTYRIQSSETLTNWADRGPAMDLGNGSFVFEDLDAGLWPRRFYRVHLP